MLRVPFRCTALLGAALFVLLAVQQFPATVPALAQPNKETPREQIDRLTNDLKALRDQMDRSPKDFAELSKDGKFRDALKALRDQIFAVDCDLDPVNAVPCRLKQFTALVAMWMAFFDQNRLQTLPENQKKLVAAEIKTTLETLTRLEQLDPAAAVTSGMVRLTQTLGAVKDKVDPKTPNLSATVTNLREALKALPPGDPKINVVDAWYGDLFDIEYMVYRGGVRDPSVGARFCLATPAVRTFCQAKTECFNPTAADAQGTLQKAENGDVASIDGAHLCGFDPAPFADAQIKGLVILYQCLSASDEEWRSLSEITPHYLPKSMGAEVNPKDWKYSGGYNARSAQRPDDLIVAVLRTGAGTDIRCVRQVH